MLLSSKLHPFTAGRLGVLFLAACLTLTAGCQCHRKQQDSPGSILTTTNSKPSLSLEERKASLETEAQGRLQEIDRASQRMQRSSERLDESLRLKWKSALDQLQDGENTAAKKMGGLKDVEEKDWEEFQRDTHRALDELDLLREDAEAYFKEKS